MSSRTQIANTALLRIGVSQFLTDLDVDNSAAAIACRLLYDEERLNTLRDFNWPFARAYATLALAAGSTDAPANPDWIYAYTWPADCVFVRRILNCFGRQATSPPPYVIGRATAGGRLILTNQTDAAAEYTFDVTDAAELEPLFASMFAWRLAAQLALSLSRLPEIAKSSMEFYAAERAEAISRSLAEAEYAIASGESDPAVREIFNLAITRLGISRSAAAVDPELTFAQLWPRVNYASERKFVLREFPWAFSTAYAVPAFVAGTAAVPVSGDWIYSYAQPPNCLFVRRIVTPAGRTDAAPPAFKTGLGVINPTADVGDQVRGKLIFSNVPIDADHHTSIEYSIDVDDPAELDAMFSSVLAWRIAALLAPSIGKTKTDPQIVARCNQAYAIEASRAQRASLNEQSEEPPLEAEWIRGRS